MATVKIKTATRKRIESEIAKHMQSKEWQAEDHPKHLDTVTKVYKLYCQACRSK